MKTYSLTLQVLLYSCINKFGALVRLYLNWLSTFKKDFKTAMIEVSVLSMRGRLQAKRENMSFKTKRYLYLSLNFEWELISARSISQKSLIFVTVYGILGKLFLTGLCTV